MTSEMTDTRALELLELLGEYAGAYGADLSRELTVRELAGDLIDSLPRHLSAGPSVNRARANIERTFGRDSLTR
jgi:hypothetical protein